MIAMMPQVQLRSFCSEEVWHPRTEVAKILVYGTGCRTSGPTQKQLIGVLSKGERRYRIRSFSLADFLSRSF